MTHPIEGYFAQGVQLFNQRNFFEAHEAWEQEWKIAEGMDRIFYQGIIQAAVALLHVQRGNYAGAISVYRKSCPKLDQFPLMWMGIELGKFRSDLAQYFAALPTSVNNGYDHHQPAASEQIAGTEQPPTIAWAPL